MSRGRIGISRRSPWPYSIRLNGTGLMCGTKTRQATEYVSAKPQSDAQAAPPDFSYGASDPSLGAVTPYEQFRLGMGLKAQRSQNAKDDEQYDHAIGIDFSVYPWVVGPEITIFAPATTDTTNGVTGFMRVGAVLYAVVGRYALSRTSDTNWPVAQDFGASKAATDCKAFYSNAHAAAHGLVAMGDSENFWYVTAGAWTQTSGGDAMKARAFGVAARELYRAHSINALTKVDIDEDWKLVANWGNDFAFDVGDQSAGIVRLPTTADGILLPIKEDGVYTLQGVNDPDPGYDRKLQDFLPDASNGKAVGRWGNDLYVGSTYSGFWRYDLDLARKQVGPELLTDGSNVVSGYVTACEGTNFALYGGFHNPSTGLSYLCKYLGVTEIDGRAHPIWHGSLSDAYASKITAMAVDTAGAPTGHARLYLGFGDGGLGWFTLPCTPHPADCPDYDFRTTDATGYFPEWHGGFPANDKALEAVTVVAKNFSATTSAEVAYRTSPTGSYTAMNDPFDTGSREKVEFPTALSSTTLGIELTLVNADASASPQITGLGIHHQRHDPYKQVFQIPILADSGLVRRDGTPLRIGRDRIKEVVETAADTAGGVTLPDGASKQVRVRNISQGAAWDGPRGARRAFVLEFTEVQTNVTHGTHGRIMSLGSHAAMENYTHAQLMTI
jgi:hypothetical protein